MISSVRGTVLHVGVASAVVEVGGVGLAIQVTPSHALSLRVGSEARLHTVLIVREDDLSLFGFASAAELEMFDLLRGVSGVGPKSALGVLATLSPDQIAAAVSTEDDAPFRKVSGIGPKTAKLIVVSLAGKILAPAGPTAVAGAAPVAATRSVVEALVGLGWNERVATEAVDDVVAELAGADLPPTAGLLRLALAHLGPQQVRS